MQGDLEAAIDAWRDALGSDRITLGDAVRRRSAHGTYPLRTESTVCIAPRSAAEVATTLRLAARFAVRVHPFSRGCNWGYGSRHPACDGAVSLDLSRLDVIRALDTELGVVELEPGVTWRQLEDALRNTGWFTSTPGTRPDASVLANTLQRGVGGGRVPMRCASLIGLEVARANGEIVSTGGASIDGAAAASVDPHGAGSELTGLFVQSRLGVVTSARLALERRPAAHVPLSIEIDARERLGQAIDTLRDLRQREVLTGSVGIYNDVRLQSYASASSDVMDMPTWLAETEVFAPSAAALDALVDAATDALRGVGLHAVLGDYGEPGALLAPSSHDALRSAWCNKRTPPPLQLDPDADGVGLIWHGVAVPARGTAVEQVVDCMTAELLHAKIEPSLSLQLLDGRRILALAQISWDREVPGQDDTAMAAASALDTALSAAGWFPYRAPLGGRPLPRRRENRDLLEQLRGVFDPNRVL